MEKSRGLTLALTLLLSSALIIISVPISGVKAQETFPWGANVPSTGEPVSSPVLEAGKHYRIVATEVFWYNVTANLAADAQYYTTDASDHWNWVNYYYYGHSFLRINGGDVDWGPFSNGDTGHTYTINYIGAGAAITFKIVDWIDDDYTNNGCHIPVWIYELPCPYTIGFWKNHPDEWPVEYLEIGGVGYYQDDLLPILRKANAKDATSMLAAQLIAAKLNMLNGAYTPQSILDTIADADTFLSIHPLGSNPRGSDRSYALMLKDTLDYFNNGY